MSQAGLDVQTSFFSFSGTHKVIVQSLMDCFYDTFIVHFYSTLHTLYINCLVKVTGMLFKNVSRSTERNS